MKPRTIMASSPSITALVPTMLAMTPPRSMSPTMMTGTLAAREKPILAMSLLPQIDFGRAAGALDEDEVGLALQPGETVQHLRHQRRLDRLVFGGARRAEHLALHDDLRADLALRLQQHRVHVDARRHPRGARLQRLRPADLAAVGGHRRIVRHVLRLERPHVQAAIGEGARQPGHDQRLADIRAGALEHDGAGGHAAGVAVASDSSERRRSFAPPSVLPDISPTRGEIGRQLGLRRIVLASLNELAKAEAASRSPPLWGRCPAGQRGAT